MQELVARFNALFDQGLSAGKGIAVAFCAFFFMVAAFKYAAAGGDPRERSVGRLGMVAALVGMVGVLLARPFMLAVRQAIGG